MYQEASKTQYFLFDEKITKCIQEGNAVAATDALVKNGKMRGRWILSDRQRSVEISRELYHKE